jgi:hypothetical protein
MLLTFTPPRNLLSAGAGIASGEGRGCELSRRATALVLFPRLDAIPGPWLLLLAATFTFVTVRTLELGIF